MDKGTKNYRDMMKRMEKMDPNSVVREGEINLERPGGMMGGTPDMLRREGENMNVMGNMGANAPSDLSIVFELMKALDPRSVLREGEILDTPSPMSSIAPLRKLYNDIIGGKVLTDAQRDSFIKSTNEARRITELPDGNMVNREGKRIFDDMGNIRDDAMSGMSMEDRQAIEALTTMGISLEDAMEAVMGTVPEGMVEGAVGATMGGGALGALPMSRPTTRPDEFGADRTQSMDMQKEGMGT